jgi:sugar phosphate permease
VRNKPREIGGASIEEIEHITVTDVRPLGVGESLKMLTSKHTFWTIAIMFFVFYGTMMGFQGLWAGPYLMNVYHLSNAEAGKLLTMIPIGMIIGCPMAGILADKIVKSKKKVIFTGTICYIGTWIPLVLWIDRMPIGFIRILLLIFGIFGGIFAIFSGNLQENLDTRMAGTGIGILNFFAFAGGAVYQQLMAGIISRAPVSNNIIAVSGFRSAFILCLVSLVIALLFYSTQKDIGGTRGRSS